ncbi:MAG: efflux RND transporter permease subunit, partial [Usitatibacter sp.]
MARFFIDRPIFAWVIAILIMVAGAISITQLPISRYPTIAPPTVSVGATYPGASAKVVEDSITQIIEQNMTGLDGLIYMSSTSASNGSAQVTLTFQSGTNPDIAQVQVQNKLQAALPLLPQIVQTQGVRVNKANPGFLMVLGFVSENNSMDRVDIADYLNTTISEPVSRLEGVGGVQVFGARYAMRIWLDPNKLDTFKLTTAQVIAALRAQNSQVAVGQLGGTPAVPGQQINATVTAQGRLETPDQFRAIIVRSLADGSNVKLGDVARVEIGAESYDVIGRYNGQQATGIAINLATNANALDTAKRVEELVKRLEPKFPAGL